jgi:hypothetical protein
MHCAAIISLPEARSFGCGKAALYYTVMIQPEAKKF